MFSVDDTIVAIATAPGRGAVGVVRVSGPKAMAVAGRVLELGRALSPRHATLLRVRSEEGNLASAGDQVVALYFKGPHSFTGQDTVEISAHGSPVVLQSIVAAAVAAGARLAQRGEFTLRAFVNGKIDLVQAEAIGDLISAVTPAQARVAYEQLGGSLTRRVGVLHDRLFDVIARLEASLDFPEEGFHFSGAHEVASQLLRLQEEISTVLADARRGRTIREGATAVIVGRPNAGKSSLFNALLGHERAIVTEVAGTTRDLVTEAFSAGGVPVTLVDTAGFRATSDPVEEEGVRRAVRAREGADVVIVVLDQTEALCDEDRAIVSATEGRPRVMVASKGDAPRASGFSPPVDVVTSARTGEGVEALKAAIAACLVGEDGAGGEAPGISNIRHIRLLEEARGHVQAGLEALEQGGLPEEFVLTHLQAARAEFDEVVGQRTSEDVLSRIFSTFCIGK